MTVGDIVGAIGGFGVLSGGSTDLNVEFVSDFLETLLVLREEGHLQVNGATEGSSEVGGAGRNVTEMLVVSELGDILDGGNGTAESLEDSADVGTRLHGDDSQLVLLVNPHKEGLVVVVENTSVVGPVTVKVASLKETVTLPRVGLIKKVFLLE